MSSACHRLLVPLRTRTCLCGLVSACGAGVSAATLLGFVGRLWWVLDLFAHFRVQYLVALTVAALALLVLRRWLTVACFGLFWLVNLVTILPLYVGGRHAAAASGPVVRAMLSNVRTHGGDPVLVAAAVREFDPQILVLQEVSEGWLRELAGVLAAYPYARTHPRGDNFGIGLFSKFPFVRCESVFIEQARVPTVVAEVALDTGSCTVVATHPLPPMSATCSRMRNQHLREVAALTRRARPPVLLLGDLNVTRWSGHFRSFVRESGLRDSALGRGWQPTWPMDNLLFLIPIDHCLHSEGIHVVDRRLGSRVGSDHLPVLVEFRITTPSEPPPRR